MPYIKYIFCFLFLLLTSNCSGGSNKSVSGKEFEDSEKQSQTDSIRWGNPDGRLGYLNNDNYKDSVVLEIGYTDGTSVSRISVYFGTKDGGYNLFKKYDCEDYWDELGLTISGDTIRCSGYGTTYLFKFKGDDFYLQGYEFIDMCCPKYKLDFNTKKMTFVLDLTDGIMNDSIYYRSIDIPQDKIPTSYTITDCFKKDFSKYISYDEDSLNSKIKEYVKEINEEIRGGKSTVIDNDTLLLFHEEIKTNEYDYTLSVSIDRKGLTNELKQFLEAEMCKMLAKDDEHIYDNIADAYKARKQEWEKEFDFNFKNDPDSYYKDSYFISRIGSHNNLITFNIGTFHYDQYAGRGDEKERYITYDKNTLEDFTWDMVKKEEGLHKLMVEGLMKYYNVNSIEDMWLNDDYKQGKYIPFPKNPPFVINDTLILQFHRWEITDAWGAGWPSAKIPFNKVVPYMTDKGKQFLNIKE
ncbi:MAG: hypothetical protein K6G31_04730 [Paludibacteraceae bacterium]|nr:hypothetical protein [Paludibacteraceae bacterium]